MRNERVIKIKMHGMKKLFRILGPEDTIQEGDLQYYPSFNAHRPLEKKQKIADVSTEEIQGWLIGTNPQPTNAAGKSMSEHEYRIYLRPVNTQLKGQVHAKK